MIIEVQLRTFLKTQSDQEDVETSACVELDNFELDNDGRLELRSGSLLKTFLDEMTCKYLLRTNTSKGRFFIGYNEAKKTYFKINRL